MMIHFFRTVSAPMSTAVKDPVPIVPLVARVSFFHSRQKKKQATLPLTSAAERAVRKRRSVDEALSAHRTSAPKRDSTGTQN